MSAVRSCYRPPKRRPHVICSMGSFFLLFSFFLYSHLTSCIRAHDHLRVALLLQMMFAAEPVRSCYRPPKRKRHVLRAVMLFFLPFPSHLIYHLTSCIRDSLHFARRFAPSKCVRCGTSSILFSPTIMKSPTCSAPWDFLLPFPFFLYSHITSCIRAHDHLRVALLLQMMFAAEPVRSCFRPP